MELKLIRKHFTDESTISDLFVDEKFFSNVIEDKDRQIKQTDSIEYISQIKVHGKTAIPTGRYQIVYTFSNRFKKLMPLLVNVPGFSGIRIHNGRLKATAIDTEGCLIPGSQEGTDSLSGSKAAFIALNKILWAASKKEKIFITIQSEKAL